MAIQRIGIEADLGIQAFQLAALGYHQRVDLEHCHVLGDKGSVKLGGEFFRLLGKVAVQAQRPRDGAAVVRHHAGGGIDREADDFFRGVVGHRLDVHAAFGRHHERDARGDAVDQHREIELLVDIGAVLDVEPVDLLAERPGLHRHQGVLQHLLRECADFLDGLRDPHAALGVFGQLLELALAAAAGMDLGLHHIDRTGQRPGRGNGFLGGEGRHARGDRRAELLQDRLALVLMNIHVVRSPCDPLVDGRCGPPGAVTDFWYCVLCIPERKTSRESNALRVIGAMDVSAMSPNR